MEDLPDVPTEPLPKSPTNEPGTQSSEQSFFCFALINLAPQESKEGALAGHFIIPMFLSQT